jgi:hypothetical protein
LDLIIQLKMGKWFDISLKKEDNSQNQMI